MKKLYGRIQNPRIVPVKYLGNDGVRDFYSIHFQGNPEKLTVYSVRELPVRGEIVQYVEFHMDYTRWKNSYLAHCVENLKKALKEQAHFKKMANSTCA